LRHDGAGEQDGLGPQALREVLVQDALVSPERAMSVRLVGQWRKCSLLF
jgi:hypothetical protein